MNLKAVFSRIAIGPLALGWYLLMPPLNGQTNKIDEYAPLTEWQNIDSFDSAYACTLASANSRNDTPAQEQESQARAEVQYQGNILTPQQERQKVNAAICVSTDDPRLAK
jgi:hypothetical protein